MIKISNHIKVLILSILLSGHAFSDYTHPSVKRLIQSNSAPIGVVFELIESDKRTWQWAAPLIKSLRTQLKEKYPDIEIAVVSHGREQFQLTQKRAKHQKQAISILKDLVIKEGVDLHVCGTHSSWYDIDPNSYLDIVDVAVSGPAKINDYINLGYQPIQLYRPPVQIK